MLGASLALVVLVAAVLVNELVFRIWLDDDYVRWYLENGAVIGFVFTLVTLVWGDINRNRFRLLISANPLEYAASSLELLTLPWASLAAMIRPDRAEWKAERNFEQAQREWEQHLPEARRMMEQMAVVAPSEELRQRALQWVARNPAPEPSDPEDAPVEPELVPTGLPVVDVAVAMIFALAFWLATLAWLLLVVPLQYFLYLATGAPARVACASPTKAWVANEESQTMISEALKWKAMPKEAIESGFTAKPVTFTAAITTAVLFAVTQLI